jgi:hypothetical protein
VSTSATTSTPVATSHHTHGSMLGSYVLPSLVPR